MELRSAGRWVAKSIGIASGFADAVMVGVFFANPYGTPTVDRSGAWMLTMPVVASSAWPP